jgi:hypothetical protein
MPVPDSAGCRPMQPISRRSLLRSMAKAISSAGMVVPDQLCQRLDWLAMKSSAIDLS